MGRSPESCGKEVRASWFLHQRELRFNVQLALFAF
jgi:hypothetical protein